jgi:hypothetical protein
LQKLLWRAVSAALLLSFILSAAAMHSPMAGAADAAGEAGAVTGRVQTSDGQPIAGVSVTLDGPAHAATATANDGTFTFGTVAPGTYVLHATKAGFASVERDDVIVAAGAPVSLNATLTASSFSSLQTIGRVSTAATGKIAMNTSTAALDVIPGSEFTDQGSLQVTQVLAEQPGVSLTSVTAGGGTNRASLGSPIYPQIRGALPYETESLIDGHPVSVGAIGTFSPLLVLPGLLQSTEIAKGPGAMPVEINYAIGGTVNYRTLEPTKDREFSVDLGADRYGGVNFTVRATGSTANNFLDYAFAYAAIGTPGPLNNYPIADSQLWLALTGTAPWTVNGQQVSGTPVHLTASPFTNFVGGPTSHFAEPLYLCCTPVNTGYDARGQLGKVRLNFSQQSTLTFSYLGGQSGDNYTGTILGSLTPMFNASTFVPPAGYVGSVPAGTPIPFDDQANTNYTEFMQSNLFQAEFRSSIGATTLLGRAYSGYDSTLVNAWTPGVAGSISENAWGGIPLCPLGTKAVGASCTGGPGGPVAPVMTYFNGQPVTLTSTNPASYTLLLDHVRGESLEGDRPIGEAVLSLALDRSNHDSYEFSLSPGQMLDTVVLPPGSGQQFTTGMLRLLTPLATNVSMMLGTYYTSYASHFTGNGGATWSDATHAGVIPRIAFSWRPESDVSWRFAAGGSIAPPYISLLSSPGTTPTLNPAGAAQGYFINANNGQIAPEKAFGYDLGIDKRLRPTLLFSSDLYFTNVSNMFLTETSQQGTYTSATGNDAGVALPLYVTQTANIGRARYEGLEWQFNDAPVQGIGYKLQGSLQRAYVYGLSPGFYYTTAGANTTNLGVIPDINFQASGNGFNATSGGRIPYSQGYAELNYRDRPGSLVLVGWTYNGPNNAYNEPAFGILSASVRFTLSTRSWFQISGYNLTGVYSEPYAALLGGVPVGLINGKFGAIAGNNVGPTTLQVNFHENFR